MRNLIYGINLTIDGCCDHTAFSGGDETLDYFTNRLHDVDLIIYGRKTYELMVPFWPDVAKNHSMNDAANRYAQTFTAINRVVVSRTLQSVADPNTKVINTNLKEEILKLKQQPGKNISLGGVDLPAQLITLGLVDEFYFLIHPVIVGRGRRLFDATAIQHQQNLKLAGSEVLQSGCIALHYTKQ